MNISGAVSLIAVVVGLGVAALALGVGQNRRWHRYRLMAAVAIAASFYCAGEILTTTVVPLRTLVVATRFQAAAGILHVFLWQLYVDRHLERPPGRFERVARGVLLLSVGMALVPGLLVAEELVVVVVPSFGLVYRGLAPTDLGGLVYLLELAFVLVPIARYVAALRADVHDAGGHLAALSAILVAGAHDAMVGTGLHNAPFLLSAGFIVSVGAMGVLLARSFLRDAGKLDRLTQQLEDRVEERTTKLVAAEIALMRAEKLGALGQLSAGVAHEINNPSAAIAANLSYLREGLVEGRLPPDAADCIDDSLGAIDRVARIVRQLHDLGRAAGMAPAGSGPVSVADAVQEALRTSESRIGSHVTVTCDLPPDLFVTASEASLVQALGHLLTNAAQAVSGSQAGQISVHAERRGDRIAIEVIDDGVGMSDATKRRIFEPFFTTRPFGEGTGLGLPLSRGIARSFGGDLHADSRPGRTVMTMELPRTTSDRPASVGTALPSDAVESSVVP